MGTTLTRGYDDQLTDSLAGWTCALTIALAFGWEPAGTVMPPDEAPGWDGNYYTNDGQIVTDGDAAACARALSRALAAQPQDVSAASPTNDASSRLVWPEGYDPAIDTSDSRARCRLRRYEQYMRGGRFCIF